MESNANAREVQVDTDAVDVLESQFSSKRRSKVWIHFLSLNSAETKDGKERALCKYCKTASFISNSHYETSNMQKHLEKCKHYTAHKKSLGNDGEEPEHYVYDQKVYRELVATAIIKHGYAFSWVEHEGNRRIHTYLNNQVRTICRNTAKADCLKMHKSLKINLKETLRNVSGRISLTCDMWTSCQTEGYLCLTAHYIDANWKLNSRVLNFCHIDSPHTGSTMYTVLLDLLQDWGIDYKIFSITLDNASSNDKMQDYLKDTFNARGALLCRGAYFHVRCAAHVLNLIVKDGLKVIEHIVVKIRNCVKYIKWSESRKVTFRHSVKLVKIEETKALWLDVPTRWNSTYMMLDRAILYREAFKQMAVVDSSFHHCPNTEEWEMLEKIRDVLEPFYDITMMFSGSDYPTANLYFENVWRIFMLLRELTKSNDTILKSTSIEMKKKFDKYWFNSSEDGYSMLFAFAVILDPRYKLSFLKYCYEIMFEDEIEASLKINDARFKLGLGSNIQASFVWNRTEQNSNELTGKLPVGLRNLTSLEYFDASDNNLEGDISEVKYLTNLVSLQLYENQFNGQVPPEMGEFKKLVNLSLYTNMFSGSLPQKLGSWADFDYIDVSENLLSGPIPPDMCKKGSMRGLLMLQNRFTGEIPTTYANCASLKRFRVSNNSLSGIVPAGIWGLPRVDIIDIAYNQFEGPITSDIKNAKAVGILSAEYNRLSGELPEEISEATSFVRIELNNNQISGKIPHGIGELKSLSNLQLQNNRLYGSIPESLGSCASISSINMANNSLSGKIPSSLGSLPTLNTLDLSRNQLSGRIPQSLSALKLSLFDLSYNQLTGPVPQSLSVEAYNGSLAGNPGLCSLTIQSFKKCPPDSGMSKSVRTLIVCFAVAAILLASLGCFLYLRRTEKDGDRSLKEESWDVKSFHVLTFTEDEILDSIKQENLIGKGGSGNVYRAMLANGVELAVKHLWKTDSHDRRKSRSSTPMLGRHSGKEKEFDAEVQTLSSIRHVNVVKLYSSITSEDSSLLVYEYLPNGSLWDRLHTSRKMELDWDTRYEIAVGAAKGLEYLHHGCERPVIHRDVKSSNILLDEFLKPRIADFGLAKMVQANGGKDSTHVIAGTHGYIAPEYGYTYKVNEKSDVYSFGVVLMELVSGKRPIEPEFGDNKDIVSWICSKIKDKESVLGIVDPRIPVSFKEDAVKVLKIAILCTTKLPALRPTMRSVVQMLEEAEPCKLVGIVIHKEGEVQKKETMESAEKLNL